jgi:hypothetical protein
MITPESTDRERYIDASRKADARISMLRALTDGMRCPRPGLYLTDCGECAVCAMQTEDGAVKYLAKFDSKAGIPGTAETRRLAKAIRADLADALPYHASIRQVQDRRARNMRAA